MNSPVQGKNVTLRASNGTSYIEFACATGCSLQVATELINTTTVGHGSFRTYKPRFTDTTLTLSGVTHTNDTADSWTVFNTLVQSLRTDGLNLEIEFEDDEGALKNVRFFAYPTSTTINSNVEDFSDFEIEFQVSGELTLDDFSTPSILSNVSSYEYTGVGGETFFSDATLIGKTILEYSRDGISKKVITAGTPTEQQVKYTSATGRFDEATTHPFSAGEWILVLYK